jgi:hypothetical protein
MSERSDDSAQSEQDEELKLEKEKLRDLDVTDEEAEGVQGGGAKSAFCGGNT